MITLSDWSGADGTSPTMAQETGFTGYAGSLSNATYTGNRSILISGSVDFQGPLPEVWTMAFTSRRIGGLWPPTTGNITLLVRSGTTNRGDVFLRNQNGGNWALRGAAGGTTYAGQSSYEVAIGSGWFRHEVTCTGTEMVYHLWHPGNDSNIPNESWTTALSSTVDNFRFGNSTGNNQLELELGPLYLDDQALPIFSGEETPGTLVLLSNVNATQTQVTMTGKTSAADAVRLRVGPLETEVTPDTRGWFSATVAGLSPNQQYYWAVDVDDMERQTGSVRTMGTDSATFVWGSCFDSMTSEVFDLIAARDPDFIVQLGDWGYQYITGGANGNTSPGDLELVMAHREPVLSAAKPQNLFTNVSTHYVYSDCDGGGANADSTTGGMATGVVQQAYRIQFSHPELPLASCGARSWVIGNVRFVLTDETTCASDKALPDDENKTKLGPEQKLWLQEQFTQAKTQGQMVIWLGDGPWVDPPAITGNSWRAYATERAEIASWTTGLSLVRLHGDTHVLWADDGTNNPYGGFPVISAAPFHTTANPYLQPNSHGTWPTVQTHSSRQYGVGVIDGDSVTFTGWSSVSPNEEVQRFQLTVTNVSDELQMELVMFDGTTETVVQPIEWDGEQALPLTLEET